MEKIFVLALLSMFSVSTFAGQVCKTHSLNNGSLGTVEDGKTACLRDSHGLSGHRFVEFKCVNGRLVATKNFNACDFLVHSKGKLLKKVAPVNTNRVE